MEFIKKNKKEINVLIGNPSLTLGYIDTELRTFIQTIKNFKLTEKEIKTIREYISKL